jgi:DNA-binding transcriptional MerR regulator
LPYKESDTVKLYYTIGEVSAMFDVNASLIRFWEKEFDVLKPRKNKKGNRLFTPADIENFRLIFHLVKEQGLTLEGAKKYLKDNKKTVRHDLKKEKSQTADLQSRLRSIRNKLQDLAAAL